MKFSIITCTYNSAAYISDNIKSVMAQSNRDFEHIFIDGNSTDDTIKIISDYVTKYPDQVKLFKSEPKGISNAMNVGIRQAQGEYLIHLHSDDSFFDKSVLNDVSDFLDKYSFDWIYGKANIIERTGKKVGVWPEKFFYHYNNKSCLGRYLLNYINFLPHQTMFIKKKVFEKFGMFDEGLISAMDYDMWFRIKDRTTWTYFDRTICNYCLRIDAQSSSLKNKEINEENILKVRKKYLNSACILVADLVDWLISKKSNYR